MGNIKQTHLGLPVPRGFVSYSTEEIKKMEYNAFDLGNKRGYFRIEHTNEDGTKEICRVESGTDQDGYRIWSIGGYTTKKGTVYLAVVAAKVLPGIKVIHHRNKKRI